MDLQDKARDIRRSLLKMIHNAKAGHTGGSLSATDILTALYFGVMNYDSKNPDWPDRDRFVLSKGHSVEVLYSTLAEAGFIQKDELNTFSAFKSRLIGHPTNKVEGIEICSGALGHGLSFATGIALGAKRTKKDFKTYVLMGDGELAEGSVWEAAIAAAHYKLDNLIAIIDRNKLQISGSTEDVMSLENLEEKWRAFGWETVSLDGHDIPLLVDYMKSRKNEGKPHMIIANTIKGKGVSYMENNAKWHHGVPTSDQLDQALKELED